MPSKNKGEFDQQKYKNQFNRENYDQISFRAEKGFREKVKTLADAKKMSIPKLFSFLVDQEMGKNN